MTNPAKSQEGPQEPRCATCPHLREGWSNTKGPARPQEQPQPGTAGGLCVKAPPQPVATGAGILWLQPEIKHPETRVCGNHPEIKRKLNPGLLVVPPGMLPDALEDEGQARAGRGFFPRLGKRKQGQQKG